MDITIINLEDELYPEKLKNIIKPPEKLYAIGNLELLNKDMLAVVGTRKITDYGKRNAEKLCTEIALRGIPIISGMALGTDTIAHKTALKCGSPTIAVLGTGLNNIFPKENTNLYNEILGSNGLVLSEIELDGKYNSSHFPRRNRIISGLSEGVLVIEAAYRSGTSITVRYAKEQGKRVFAIPGRLDNTYGVGVNKFIKDGAILVTEVNDILECYPQFMNKKRKSVIQKKIKSEYLPIYQILKEKNSSIDEISRKIKNKTISEITNILTMMELEDLVIQDLGNGYKLKGG
ncbi:MAG: DNA-processing protein DprA [Clostridia bacterium]|nr:DNA-processing protein DprA [Clostridia bacterium]